MDLCDIFSCNLRLFYLTRGHNITEEHRLHDGGLPCLPVQLTYSMNKRKRWLLPDIIEQRIRERTPNCNKNETKKNKQSYDIDDELKIVMIESEAIRYKSRCLRYGNSHIEPQFIERNGHPFNSDTLTKWLDFNIRSNRNRRRRAHRRQHEDNDDRVNQPNFGIQQRPGFLPSEVTYNFVYPRRCVSSGNNKGGKTTLNYWKLGNYIDFYGGNGENDSRNRRRMQKLECSRLSQILDDCQSIELSLANTNNMNEDDISFDESRMCIQTGDNLLTNSMIILVDLAVPTNEFPIDCFFPDAHANYQSSCSSDIVYDRKAHKFYEPLPTPILSKPTSTNEILLCSLSCVNESYFLSTMQQTAKYTSQGNISPAMFIQQTPSSPFIAIYAYQRVSHSIDVTLKFTESCPAITVDKQMHTLDAIIELVSNRMHMYENTPKKTPIMTKSGNVDDLRGSLPLPRELTQTMVLVRPHSTDKYTALREQSIMHTIDEHDPSKAWFTIDYDNCDTLECAVCCETLPMTGAYQLLPCMC
jgi:hypothetical protein